ncbi:MAG: NADH-quinone oxidoreductase subunit C, partial [Angustibacter sp.]
MTLDADAAVLAELLGLPDSAVTLAGHGVPCVDVPEDRWREVLLSCRDELGANFFDWLSAVDEPAEAALDVVVHLARCPVPRPGEPQAPVRLATVLVRTRVSAERPRLPSIGDIWPGAAWHERETHEMFGVDFDGFDDGTGLGLRPLLLPDGFSGHPLRKSFHLAARASKPWPGATEPGEAAGGAPGRRKMLPPGVPDPSWGPRAAPPAPPTVLPADQPGKAPIVAPTDESGGSPTDSGANPVLGSRT